MSNAHVLSQTEFLQRSEVDEATLERWRKRKFIKAVGLTEEGMPLFRAEDVQVIAQIRSLERLGYSLADIQTIVKKVGLPSKQETGASGKAKQYLTVGTLADRAGISPRTIKHWEDKGIIEPSMRSEGGFRLYMDVYVYLCKLIRDIQLFGYSLEEIKRISDYFRDFIKIRSHPDSYAKAETTRKLDVMLKGIERFFCKIAVYKEGMQRWEELLKKKRKEIIVLKNKNAKRKQRNAGEDHA